jgi:hypothetical protein
MSGNAVPASPNGCFNGAALYQVNSPEECVKIGSPDYKNN